MASGVRRTLLVFRFHLYRTWRRIRTNPRGVLLPIALVVGVWVYVLFQGQPGRGGDDVDPELIADVTRGMIALLWIGYTSIAAIKTPTRAPDVPGGEFVIRVVGIKPALWGFVLAR